MRGRGRREHRTEIGGKSLTKEGKRGRGEGEGVRGSRMKRFSKGAEGRRKELKRETTGKGLSKEEKRKNGEEGKKEEGGRKHRTKIGGKGLAKEQE